LLEAAAGAAFTSAVPPATAPVASVATQMRVHEARIRPIKLICGKPPSVLDFEFMVF
jgi:hypothetical protein